MTHIYHHHHLNITGLYFWNLVILWLRCQSHSILLTEAFSKNQYDPRTQLWFIWNHKENSSSCHITTWKKKITQSLLPFLSSAALCWSFITAQQQPLENMTGIQTGCIHNFIFWSCHLPKYHYLESCVFRSISAVGRIVFLFRSGKKWADNVQVISIFSLIILRTQWKTRIVKLAHHHHHHGCVMGNIT